MCPVGQKPRPAQLAPPGSASGVIFSLLACQAHAPCFHLSPPSPALHSPCRSCYSTPTAHLYQMVCSMPPSFSSTILRCWFGLGNLAVSCPQCFPFYSPFTTLICPVRCLFNWIHLCSSKEPLDPLMLAFPITWVHPLLFPALDPAWVGLCSLISKFLPTRLAEINCSHFLLHFHLS